MSNQKPIGVFDSGLGGLTVVRALKKALPFEKIIYFGDTGRVPYGTRSPKTIERYSIQDEDFLISKDVKMIIAACGTVSSVAPHTGNRLNVPFIGVVRPAAHMAAFSTRNRKIGIIGTPATISSRSYEKELLSVNPELQVYSMACPLFVPVVEEGIVDNDPQLAENAARHYLGYFSDKGIDTLILGCTHYPIMQDIIQSVMPGVNLLDIGSATANEAKRLLSEKGLLSDNLTAPECEYYVSDKTAGFARQANLFLGENIDSQVKHIELE